MSSTVHAKTQADHKRAFAAIIVTRSYYFIPTPCGMPVPLCPMPEPVHTGYMSLDYVPMRQLVHWWRYRKHIQTEKSEMRARGVGSIFADCPGHPNPIMRKRHQIA